MKKAKETSSKESMEQLAQTTGGARQSVLRIKLRERFIKKGKKLKKIVLPLHVLTN